MKIHKIKPQKTDKTVKKETSGKRKVLPKLKVVLANPYKPNNPRLMPHELAELWDLIHADMKSTNMNGKEFVKQNKICLGLESSLRAINNNKMSLVLISQSIKPRFIINQIVQFTLQKSEEVPVYVVDNLSKIFGVETIAIVFPSNLKGKLGEWVSKRTGKSQEVLSVVKKSKTEGKRKPSNNANILKQGTVDVGVNTMYIPRDPNEFELNSLVLRKDSNVLRIFMPNRIVRDETPTEPMEIRDYSGDYFSFSDIQKQNLEKYNDNFRTENSKVMSALKWMTSRVQGEESMHAYRVSSIKGAPYPVKQPLKLAYEKFDHYLTHRYSGLSANKIQGNLSRNSKKKAKAQKPTEIRII